MYEQQFNPYAANLAVIKGYFKNTKVLVLGILYIVSAVLSVVSSLFFSNFIDSFFGDYMDLLSRAGVDISELPAEFDQMISMSSAAATTSAIISAVIQALVLGLVAAGFIILYVKSRNESPDANPKAGVMILYVIALIGMILSIIAAVIIGLFCILIIVALAIAASGANNYYGGSYYVNTGALVVVYVFLFIIVAAALFYLLFTAINQKRFFGSVKDSLNTVELQNKGAKPYGVMCIISAVFTGISLVSSVTSLGGLSALGFSSGGTVLAMVLSLVSTAINLVILILNASIALGYKKHIDDMKYGYNGTPYGGVQAGGYAPAPAQDPYAPQQPYDAYNNYAAPQQPTRDSYSAPAQQDAGYAVPQQPEAPAAPASAFCPHCGAPVDPAAPFCGNCGNRLNP